MFMLLCGLIAGILNGNIRQVSDAFINGASEGIKLCIGITGIICLWSGLSEISARGGLTELLSKLSRPVIGKLFNGIPKSHPSLGAIFMNLAANFLGMGNAATPLGIKAIEEMNKLNTDKEKATNEMCMFIVLNTAAIQLVPATVIALRASQNSANPGVVTPVIWLTSLCASIAGVVFVLIARKVSK